MMRIAAALPNVRAALHAAARTGSPGTTSPRDGAPLPRDPAEIPESPECEPRIGVVTQQHCKRLYLANLDARRFPDDFTNEAHLFAQQAAALTRPADALFVDESVYAWRTLDELSVSAYHVGAIEQGRQALARLVAEARFPAHHQARIEGNRQYFGL